MRIQSVVSFLLPTGIFPLICRIWISNAWQETFKCNLYVSTYLSSFAFRQSQIKRGKAPNPPHKTRWCRCFPSSVSLVTSGFVFEACHGLNACITYQTNPLGSKPNFPQVPWRVLTHAGRQQPGPVVILLADAHRGTDEPETRVALINYRIPVAEVFTDHLTVHDPFRSAAVASWGKNIQNICSEYTNIVLNV